MRTEIKSEGKVNVSIARHQARVWAIPDPLFASLLPLAPAHPDELLFATEGIYPAKQLVLGFSEEQRYKLAKQVIKAHFDLRRLGLDFVLTPEHLFINLQRELILLPVELIVRPEPRQPFGLAHSTEEQALVRRAAFLLYQLLVKPEPIQQNLQEILLQLQAVSPKDSAHFCLKEMLDPNPKNLLKIPEVSICSYRMKPQPTLKQAPPQQFVCKPPARASHSKLYWKAINFKRLSERIEAECTVAQEEMQSTDRTDRVLLQEYSWLADEAISRISRLKSEPRQVWMFPCFLLVRAILVRRLAFQDEAALEADLREVRQFARQIQSNQNCMKLYRDWQHLLEGELSEQSVGESLPALAEHFTAMLEDAKSRGRREPERLAYLFYFLMGLLLVQPGRMFVQQDFQSLRDKLEGEGFQTRPTLQILEVYSQLVDQIK